MTGETGEHVHALGFDLGGEHPRTREEMMSCHGSAVEAG